MTPKRLSYVMTGVFILLVGLGIGLAFYSSGWLKKKSDRIVEIKLDTAALEEQKKTAIQAEAELKEYAKTKESIDKIVPKSKDQARAVVELLQIASDVNTTINSITFPTSDLGLVQKTPATTPTENTDSSSGTTDNQASSQPKTSSISQAKPVEGLSGILGMDVIISQIDTRGATPGSGMSYQQLISFLQGIERNRRTMQVKSIQIQPIRTDGSTVSGYSLTLNLTVFVKP